MQRVLEPEVMDLEAEVTAYARAELSDSTVPPRAPCSPPSWSYAASRTRHRRRSGNIPTWSRKMPTVDVVAVDASGPMLKIAREGVAARVGGPCHLVRVTPARSGLPSIRLRSDPSKDMLHHIPDPRRSGPRSPVCTASASEKRAYSSWICVGQKARMTRCVSSSPSLRTKAHY